MNASGINDSGINDAGASIAWMPAAVLTLIAKPPAATQDPPVNRPGSARWRAYLVADGQTDLELPISSLQMRRRSGDPSYLSIVVPAPTPYLDGIAARSPGTIVLKSGFAVGTTEVLNELLRVALDSVRYDLGARSGSATLDGYAAVDYGQPKTRTLRNISYRSATNGQRRVRCEPDMWLAPGDTADLGGGESMTVGSLMYTVSPLQSSMEVTEAES